MAGRGDRADYAQTSLHRSEGFPIRQTKLDGFRLTGVELKRIIRCHFCARLLGVYGGFIPAYQVFVESVFHVWRAIFAIEQAGVVGLVLREEQFRLAGAEKPSLAVSPMFDLGTYTAGDACGPLRVWPAQILTPGPGVAEPQGREKMKRSCLGAAIYGCDFYQNVFDVRLGIFDKYIEIAIFSENACVEKLEFGVLPASFFIFIHEARIREFCLWVFV